METDKDPELSRQRCLVSWATPLAKRLSAEAAERLERANLSSGTCQLSRQLSQLSVRSNKSNSSSASFTEVARRRLDRTLSGRSNKSSSSAKSHESTRVIGPPLGTLRIMNLDNFCEKEAMHHDEEQPRSSDPSGSEATLEGSVLVFLTVPPGFDVGLDATAYRTADDRPTGYCKIPPGPHLTWVSQPGSMLKSGYWFIGSETASRGPVMVKTWDRHEEMVTEAMRVDVEEQRRAIQSSSERLVPYGATKEGTDSAWSTQHHTRLVNGAALDRPNLWKRVTSAIDAPYLDLVTSRKGAREWTVHSTDTVKRQSQVYEPGRTLMNSLLGSEFHFLSLGPVGSVITQPEVVAELQFTFLNSVHLANDACIQRWWHLVLQRLLFAGHQAMSQPKVYTWLLETLQAQLVYNEIVMGSDRTEVDGTQDSARSSTRVEGGGGIYAGGILDYVPGNKRQLRLALTRFKRELEEYRRENRVGLMQGALWDALAAIESWIWMYGWELNTKETLRDCSATARTGSKLGRNGHFNDLHGDIHDDGDDDDYEPVVVEVDQNGRQIGLVNFR